MNDSKNIIKLKSSITNEHQIKILEKLLGSDEQDRIYFSSYEKNNSTSAKLANLEGIFNILGTMKKGVRESYNIKLFKLNKNLKGSFWCSCPDHKFNSAKKNTICKHICFIICKIGKIFRTSFFDDKQLYDDEINDILAKIESTSILNDKTLCKIDQNNIKPDIFYKIVKPVLDDDVCIICYDDLNKNKIVVCPSCSNNLHIDCMKVWLEKNDICIFCRSDIWKKFK